MEWGLTHKCQFFAFLHRRSQVASYIGIGGRGVKCLMAQKRVLGKRVKGKTEQDQSYCSRSLRKLTEEAEKQVNFQIVEPRSFGWLEAKKPLCMRLSRTQESHMDLSTGSGIVECLLGNTQWFIQAQLNLLSSQASTCFPVQETMLAFKTQESTALSYRIRQASNTWRQIKTHVLAVPGLFASKPNEVASSFTNYRVGNSRSFLKSREW